jgi:hypothetical protein
MNHERYLHFLKKRIKQTPLNNSSMKEKMALYAELSHYAQLKDHKKDTSDEIWDYFSELQKLYSLESLEPRPNEALMSVAKPSRPNPKIELFKLENNLTKPSLSNPTSNRILFFPKKELITPDSGTTMDQDLKEHEKLAEMLAESTSRILENSKTFAQHLKADVANLIALEGTLSENSSRIKVERSSISKASSSTWTTTILIWGAVLLALLVFLWAFLYIRLISPVKIKTIVKMITAAPTSTQHFEL